MTAKRAPTHAKNADLTPQKTAYVAWLLDTDRTPRTQVELAKQLGVDAATLSDWKRDEFVVGLLKRANEFVEPKWAEVLRTLFLIARDPDHIACVQAARELGKLLNKYPTAKIEHSGKVETIERVEIVPAHWPEYDAGGKIVPIRRAS